MKIPMPPLGNFNEDEISQAINRLVGELERRAAEASDWKRVVVKFPTTSTYYTYLAPIDAEVGDTVKTPAPDFRSSEGLAEIKRIGSNWEGHTKRVLALYKKGA